VTERSFTARNAATGRPSTAKPGVGSLPKQPSPDAPPPPVPQPAPDGDARSATDPIRVLIADDHAFFRRGLEVVLQGEAGLEIVGQASDGAEAVALATEVAPDVVLMDIRMPKMTGIEAARQMKEVAPSAKIVMLTISDEEEDRFEAIRAGASGYCNVPQRA
jgi:CheY-like chemotaxis protein